MINYTKALKMASLLGVPEETVEKDYFIELLLSFLSDSNFFKTNFVFRGGTALRKMYFKDYRFSEDLDFITQKQNALEDSEKIIKGLLAGMSSEYTAKLAPGAKYQQGRAQYFVIYDLIPEIRAVKELKLDLCLDLQAYANQERALLSAFGEFEKKKTLLYTCDLETIAGDKIGAIMDNRNEARDVYDIWCILKADIDVKKVTKSYREKYGYKIYLQGLLEAVQKEAYRNTWETRLKNQVAGLPDFNLVIKEVTHLLKEKFS